MGKNKVIHFLAPNDSVFIFRFLKHLRLYEKNIKEKTTIITIIKRLYHLRYYQKYASKLGYCIGDGVLGKDVVFYHRGSIIINPDARVGDGCRFHGDAVLGVAHTGDKGCPRLGKNVDIGAGAKILGDIYIADNIVIGANAVVTKSFTESGITIAGIPARKIRDAQGNRV